MLSNAMSLLLARALVLAAWADGKPQAADETVFSDVDDERQSNDGGNAVADDAALLIDASLVEAVVDVPLEEGSKWSFKPKNAEAWVGC